MKRYIVKLLIFFTFLSSGCKNEEWFDIKSDKQLSVPSTFSDLQALLDNGDLFNTSCPEMGENASDYHSYPDNVLSILPGFEKNSYTWSKEKPNIGVIDWSNGIYGSYAKVYCANLILESIDKIISNDSNLKNSIKGQALFFRAKTFYELATVFVPPYDKLTSNNRYGIPLRLASDVNIKSVRSTVEETYSQIVKDLSESINLLPTVQNLATRPSKLAAYALLSRIFLSLENYPDALRYADLCLQGQNTLINYTTLNYQSSDNPFIGYNKEVILYSNMNGFYFSSQNITIDKVFYESYDENDLRKQVYFNFNSVTGLVLHKGNYSGLGFLSFFNGLANDELYLIRAECYARSGNTTEAMKDLNALLKTRWLGAYTDLTAGNADEALRIILRERKKELVLRGVRWSDLRRLNKDSRFVQTFTRIVEDKTYTLEPNSYKYTFPLPDDVIEKTGMEQNPGWK